MALSMAQFTEDMKTAMKARESERLQTIRMLISALKNEQINLGHEPDSEEIISVLATEAKKRREAIDAYREGGREQLAEKEEAELAVIEDYLPRQLEDAEVEQMIDDLIASTGASTKAEMGKVMGGLMPQLKGRYDGGKAKKIVMSKLA